MSLHARISSFLLFGLLLFGCTGFLAGTETETQTGTVSAKVVRKSDSAVFSNKAVRLHSSHESDSPTAVSTVTDSQGYFILDSVTTGVYYLEIGDSSVAVLSPCTVKVNKDWFDTLYAEPTGTIIGNLCVPFVGDIFSIEVYIAEINLRITIDTSGIFRISFLPAYSSYTFTLDYVTSALKIPIYVDSSIAIAPGDTASIGNIALFRGNARVYGVCSHAMASAHRATLTVTAYNLLPIHASMTIVDTMNVYGVVEGIPEGLDRIFRVDVFDSNNVLLSTGSDTTDIVADSTCALRINLNGK